MIFLTHTFLISLVPLDDERLYELIRTNNLRNSKKGNVDIYYNEFLDLH